MAEKDLLRDRIQSTVTALLALPLLIWVDYPKERGMLNLYPILRYINMVRSTLLLTSAWSIVMSMFALAPVVRHKPALVL